MIKGLILYYLDRNVFNKISEEEIEMLKMMSQTNKSLIDSFLTEGYTVLFLMTTNEATRIEKIDFDQVWPIPEEDDELAVYDTPTTNGGLVTCYINRDDGFRVGEEEELMTCMNNINSDILKHCHESGYSVFFIPTVSEGTRIQKIDFEYPFPLYP